MIRPRLLSASLLPLLWLGPDSQAQTPDCRVVPGWEQEGDPRAFESENLFDYMNGNAEGYLIYGFSRMNGVTCRCGEVTFVVDISEMADPDAAYGLFGSNRDPRLPVEKIGTIAQIQPRRAIFAKDKYFVELAANPEGDHREALRTFARALETRLPGSTALPAPLGWFPEDRLVQDSIRLVPQSVLGIGLLKRGYTAQYDFGRAFVVMESSPESAASVLNKMRSRSGEAIPAAIADEAFLARDKYLGRLCLFRKGRYVAGLVGFAEGIDPLRLASDLAARLP